MSSDALTAMKAAVVFIKMHHFKGGLAEDVVTALDAAIKAQEAGTIPDGVYYDVLSINFYAYSGSGMGAEFYAKWFHRRFEFPTSAQPSPEPQITYESSMSPMFNSSPPCHIGARPWPEYPSSADDEATRWRHGESLSEPQGDAIAYLPAYELERLRSGHSASVHSARFGPSTLDGDIPLYLSPRPAAQISDERIREIGKDVFGIDLNFDGNLITFARALLREAPAGWRPIESAPKGGYIMGAWKEGKWHCREMFLENDEWTCTMSDRIYSPTHWMPLPAAPKEGA